MKNKLKGRASARDVFRRMIVSGRAEMSAQPSDETIRQLYLRFRLVFYQQDRFQLGEMVIGHLF
jgi:hypothetical protein